MERKKFIKTCGMACLGGTLLASLLESCSGIKMITGTINQSYLIVPVASFLEKNNSFRKYIIVQHPELQYPICVYRFSETAYKALLMRCTHQGAQLQVFGDVLECPAHGSEFNDQGDVIRGPANKNLRSFPITIYQNQLNISLK